MGSTVEQTGTPSRGLRFRLADSGEGFDSAFADRVQLYLKVTFLINLGFTLLTLFIVAAGGDGLALPLDDSAVYTTVFVTGLNGMAWFLMARSRPGFIACIATVATTTFVLSMGYTYVATNTNQIPMVDVLFALTVVSIVLVLRAALVPSPAFATALVGLVCFSCPVWASRPEVTGGGWVFTAWVVTLALVFTAVTTVTSYVVYRMERRMFAAAQLGQYQIEYLLGRGGMGEVYLAEHALLHRPTAIKLLRDASTTSAKDRFRHEVQTASGLTHPNTVEIYDYGRTPDGVFYFAMEYVEGATLEQVVLGTGAMPAARAIHLLLQAAGSLGEAHERGLVHRDVKPSNLMLCERGGILDTLKVLDFGLVRNLSDGGAGGAGLSGTPLYMSPEAILDSEGSVPQSDVYALGATAYFLLTGRPPFDGDNLVDILADHLATRPAPVQCDDEQLAELVARCLSKEPADRPEDARDFAAALRQCATFGNWDAADACVWWAEHREVVAAIAGSPLSLGSRQSGVSTV